MAVQPNVQPLVANAPVEQANPNVPQVAAAQLPPANGQAPQLPAGAVQAVKNEETKRSMQPYQFLIGTGLMTAAGAAAVAGKIITGISIAGGALFGVYAGLIGQGIEYLTSKAVDWLIPADKPTLRVLTKVALGALAFVAATVLGAMWATAVGFPVTSTAILCLTVATVGVAANLCPWIHQALRDAQAHAAAAAAKANQPAPAPVPAPVQQGPAQPAQ